MPPRCRSRFLDAAERRLGRRDGERVDADHARLDCVAIMVAVFTELVKA